MQNIQRTHQLNSEKTTRLKKGTETVTDTMLKKIYKWQNGKTIHKKKLHILCHQGNVHENHHEN